MRLNNMGFSATSGESGTFFNKGKMLTHDTCRVFRFNQVWRRHFANELHIILFVTLFIVTKKQLTFIISIKTWVCQ